MKLQEKFKKLTSKAWNDKANEKYGVEIFATYWLA